MNEDAKYFYLQVLQSQLEPAALTSLITKQAERLFEKTKTAELLACSVMYALPDKRNEMTEFAKEFIYSKDITDASTLPTLFKVCIILVKKFIFNLIFLDFTLFKNCKCLHL